MAKTKTKKRYGAYATFYASSWVGAFEASSEEEAEKLAWDRFDPPSLCHQCAKHLTLGDVDEMQVEEVSDVEG